jgi:hypothetical protein
MKARRVQLAAILPGTLSQRVRGALRIYRRYCDNFVADIAAVPPLLSRCLPLLSVAVPADKTK